MNLSKPPSNNNSRDLPPGFDKPKDLDDDQKKTAVHAELNRMSLLPSNSSYAIHRMKVLNKLLHLLSIKVIQGTIRQTLGFYCYFSEPSN